MASRLEKLSELAESKSQVFSTKELFKEAGLKKSEKTEDELFDYLLSYDFLYSDDDIFIPQSAFLPKIPIRIQLTPQEFTGRFLVLGHRVLPFLYDDLEIPDLKIFYRGSVLPREEKVFDMENFAMYISLLNGELFPVKNMDEMLSDSFKPLAEVLDISALMEKHDFKIEDSLILKSLDFKAGTFDISVEKEKEQKEKHFQIRANSKLFLEILTNVVDGELNLNQEDSVYGDLLCAYYHYSVQVNPKFAHVAPTALGPLLRTQDVFTFSRMPEGTVVFHRLDEEPSGHMPHWKDAMEDALEGLFEDKDYDLSTVDGILMSVGNTHNLDEVRAIILDQLAFEGYNFPKLLDFLFESRTKPYLPEDLESELKKLADAEHKKLLKKFDRSKHTLPVNFARRKALQILKDISLMLRKLDQNYVDVRELPGELMEYLMHIQEMLSMTLKVLEDPDNHKEVQSLVAGIEKTEPLAQQIIQEILAHFSL